MSSSSSEEVPLAKLVAARSSDGTPAAKKPKVIPANADSDSDSDDVPLAARMAKMPVPASPQAASSTKKSSKLSKKSLKQIHSGTSSGRSEKLKKIKDVCAQYFSKYEKHLINHQTIVKDLERQQEQWVRMLIKP